MQDGTLRTAQLARQVGHRRVGWGWPGGGLLDRFDGGCCFCYSISLSLKGKKNKRKEGVVQQRSRVGAGKMQHQHLLMLLAINQADQKDGGKGKCR